MALIKRFPSYPLASAAVLTPAHRDRRRRKGRDFASDIKPWLGNEVAVAFLNTTSSAAGSLIAAGRQRPVAGSRVPDEVGRHPELGLSRRPAIALPDRDGAGVRRATTLRSARVRASVRRSTSPPAPRHRWKRTPHTCGRPSTEPTDRVLDAYASAAGVQRILVSRGGLLGALGVLLYQPALDGTAISVTPVTGGVQVLIHSALSPALKRLGGAPTPPFRPTLQADAPIRRHALPGHRRPRQRSPAGVQGRGGGRYRRPDRPVAATARRRTRRRGREPAVDRFDLFGGDSGGRAAGRRRGGRQLATAGG